MKKLALIASSIAGVGVLSLSALGVASAATSSGNVGTSGIPRTVYRQERLDAVAQVLNTTPTAIQTAHKGKDLRDLISKAGLTKQTFSAKVKTELTSDLESKGYTQDQITIAMQHRTIARMHHHHKKTT